MSDRAPRHDAIDLGWFTLCLKAPDLPAMTAFYEALGFGIVGGDPDHGYAVLGSGPVAITPMSFLAADLPNFRGGDIPALARELAARGLEPVHGDGFDPGDPAVEYRAGPRLYDAAKWPAAYHTGPDGKPLPAEDSGDFMVRDPDGVVIYFDTVPVERARHRAGERHCTERMRDGPGEPDLGRFLPEVGVRDLAASRAFYERLGLRLLAEDHGTCELANDLRIPFRLALRQGAEGIRLVFVGADLPAVAAALARKGLRLDEDADLGEERAIRDPAGHALCFR